MTIREARCGSTIPCGAACCARCRRRRGTGTARSSWAGGSSFPRAEARPTTRRAAGSSSTTCRAADRLAPPGSGVPRRGEKLMREVPTGDETITRRQALRGLGALGLAATAGSATEALLARAAAAAPRTGSLKDIEHVVILIQENRSFDHYFGTLRGVRGFGDKRGRHAFFQRGLGGQTLHPFHLDTGCLPDLTHDWGPQHASWNGGRMDGFLSEHETVDVPSDYGSPNGTGVETMGYYTRRDLSFYYALADAFTVCDMYFCSVIGPTYPNRLLSISATLDPDGTHGGPLVETLGVSNYAAYLRRFTWTTMMDRLSAHGVSWKVYN